MLLGPATGTIRYASNISIPPQSLNDQCSLHYPLSVAHGAEGRVFPIISASPRWAGQIGLVGFWNKTKGADMYS
jgi:hypothetical protein